MGNKSINEFAKLVVASLKQNKDVVIADCGYERSGKSTLAYWLSEAIAKEAGTDFSPTKNIFYNPTRDDLLDQINALPNMSAILIDESYKAFNKLEFMTKKARRLNQLFTMCGHKNHALIMCMPRFLDFNEYQRNHRIRLWVQVVTRGRAVVFERENNMFTNDPWNIRINYKKTMELSNSKFSDFVAPKKMDIYKKCHGYKGTILWDALPEDKQVEYNKFSIEAKMKIDEEDAANSKEEMFRISLQKMICYAYSLDDDITQTELAKIAGLSQSTVNHLLKGGKSRKIDKITALTDNRK